MSVQMLEFLPRAWNQRATQLLPYTIHSNADLIISCLNASSGGGTYKLLTLIVVLVNEKLLPLCMLYESHQYDYHN